VAGDISTERQLKRRYGYGELLSPEDPLLPHVVNQARFSLHCLRWVRESAKRWAVAEFMERELRREDGEELIYDMDLRLQELARHMVAVRVDDNHWESGAMVGSHRILVGLLGPMSNEEYIDLTFEPGVVLTGMMPVIDVVEVSECYRVSPWPQAFATT
jgi:hypothetical protein